eukprot:7853333-Pyramimonas_sp.AAC.1
MEHDMLQLQSRSNLGCSSSNRDPTRGARAQTVIEYVTAQVDRTWDVGVPLEISHGMLELKLGQRGALGLKRGICHDM